MQQSVHDKFVETASRTHRYNHYTSIHPTWTWLIRRPCLRCSWWRLLTLLTLNSQTSLIFFDWTVLWHNIYDFNNMNPNCRSVQFLLSKFRSDAHSLFQSLFSPVLQSAYRQNNWRTYVKYHNLPVDPQLRRKYQTVLMNENINWKEQVICSALWSKRERHFHEDIPDIQCT